jgi:two-component system sensor histidine kinase PilS (NtrC family)
MRDSEPPEPSTGILQSDDERLAAQLRRVVFVRLVAIVSFLASFFVLRVFLTQAPAGALDGDSLLAPSVDGIVYTFLILALALNLFFLLQLRHRRTPLRVQAGLQFTSDLLLTTVMVYSFGGASSPFSSIFFVVIILAAAFLGRRAGLSIAGAAWCLYAVAALARASAWLPGTIGSEESLAEIVYRLGLHLLGFLLVAVLASRLARELSRAEGDLARLRVVHRDIVESIPSGLVTFDLDGKILTANAAAPRILGQPREALIGHTIEATGLFRDLSWKEFVGFGEVTSTRLETSYERDGETRPIGFSLTQLTSPDGRQVGFVLIFQDLHEWRMLQEEVQLKDRMAAVGEMAAGMAHEIGNPLAALSGSAQMLQKSLAEGSSQRTLLDIILRESRRLDRTIKSFLQFSRPRERSSVRFDIAELLRNNTELLRNSEERLPGHRIHLELDAEQADVIADADQISQIFWNLARNALRAMDSEGDLHVEGRLGDAVYRMVFRDTGRGMSDGERAQLFYPFRTSFRGGTGIGMAIVYRIVEEHGGRLIVDSEVGEGTSIAVELPLAEAAAAVNA